VVLFCDLFIHLAVNSNERIDCNYVLDL
jgi:hypothetical protein